MMRLNLFRRLSSSSLALFATSTLALGILLGFSASASATICDSDPGAVDFEATVDPTTLENFLSALGELEILPDQLSLVIPGLCTDHQIKLDTAIFALLTDAAPFLVSPVFGSISMWSVRCRWTRRSFHTSAVCMARTWAATR